MKAISNWDYVSAEYTWPRICVVSRARGENKQICLAWSGGVRKETEFWCSGKATATEYTERLRQWCQHADIMHGRDIPKEVDRQFAVRHRICSVWGQSNNSGMTASKCSQHEGTCRKQVTCLLTDADYIREDSPASNWRHLEVESLAIPWFNFQKLWLRKWAKRTGPCWVFYC